MTSAGWFSDPAGRSGTYRWWDGSTWTRVLTTDPESPAPVTPSARQATEPAIQPSMRVGPPADSLLNPPGYPPVVRSLRPIGPRSLIVAIAAVVVAVVVVVIVRHATTPPLLAPPPPVPAEPAPTPQPSASAPPFPLKTRKFSMDGLNVTMPGRPYKLNPVDDPYSYLGGSGVQGLVVVHAAYDGKKGHNWYAVCDAGELDGEALGVNLGKSITDAANNFLSSYTKNAFDGAHVTVRNQKQRTVTENVARPVRIITARLYYKKKGVASRYDDFRLVITKAPSGNYVGFLADEPNDTSARAKKALQASIATIRVV